MPKQTLTIDVVSDVMCPWCYIGKRRLEKALAASPDVEVEVRWRPFQLDPTIPERGMDRRQYLERKFGDDKAIARLQAPVKVAGEAEGIAFAMEKIVRSPNTLNAHRLIRWAEQAGRQDEMVERLFQLYFTEGADLTDPKVLKSAAADAGLDANAVERLLAGDADLAEVKDEIEQAQRMGVTGVPTFIIANRYAVVGAREPEVIAGAIARAAKEAA